MNLTNVITCIFLLCHLFFACNCIEPVSTVGYLSAAVGVSSIYAGWNFLKCNIYECCSKEWIKPNFLNMSNAFNSMLHGQPLVKQVVLPSLNGHFKNRDPKKALVLSFHGWAGTGKNFVSKLVAENLFTKGMKSGYVHLFIATKHFPFPKKLDQYKQELQKKIENSVKSCQTSLFIFDEMDKMPPGLIDALKPYIDYYHDVDGVNYNRAIYIFLSNMGSKAINNLMYKFWKDGKDRNDITMKDMEPLIIKGVFNEEGGFYKSEIIERHLIDAHVPFLPLEKNHVKMCIRDDLVSKGLEVDPEFVDRVADELDYYPEEAKIFSVSGCKRISQKVDVMKADEF
ncbi:torsin-1A-like [Centruroides sculpturatus]|uniref:torsin-1A-like n=1 Tax=Centruroides sculpturatus TaxID=218467 RepID=UPI000C6E4988|nr:torsin-1A-like [Centruroides sculpturatus]